jgi:hypothetical protein
MNGGKRNTPEKPGSLGRVFYVCVFYPALAMQRL